MQKIACFEMFLTKDVDVLYDDSYKRFNTTNVCKRTGRFANGTLANKRLQKKKNGNVLEEAERELLQNYYPKSHISTECSHLLQPSSSIAAFGGRPFWI